MAPTKFKTRIVFICLCSAVWFWQAHAKAADWTAAQVATARMQAKSFTSHGARPIKVEYLLYLPKKYQTNSSAPWPLMLYLHGAGERSDNVFGVTWHGPPKLVRQGTDFPFIIVAPLCPPNQWWADSNLLKLLNAVEKEYNVDTNRVYLTGMSMGGSGTWTLGLRHADRFAAIVPICGNLKRDFFKQLSPDQTDSIKSLHIWAFHGAKDPIVPITAGERIIAALKNMGATNVAFTKYPNADHDSWTATYNNGALYQWLLKQKR